MYEAERRAEELRVLNKVYSLVKARAFILGIPDRLLAKYYRGAKDVLKRINNIDYKDGYVRATILTTKASKHMRVRSITVKDLFGNIRKIKIGVPIEDSYHHVTVTERVMKCTCPIAVRNASKANKWLEDLAKKKKLHYNSSEKLFFKHVLCKHTLAVLAKGIGYGAIPVSDALVKNLSLALIGLAVAEGYRSEALENEIEKMFRQKQY